MAAKIGRISGAPLRALAASMRTPVRQAAAALVRPQLGITEVLALPQSMRGEMPIDQRPLRARESHAREDLGLEIPETRDFQHGLGALRRAYEGGLSPTRVVEHALDQADKLARRRPSLGPLQEQDREAALRAAGESEARMRDGTARPLEGVVTVIKEEVDLRGLHTQLGTDFWTDAPASEDGTSVARLRQAGAIVLGNSMMTQFGMSPLGVNPHRRMPRNAHSPGHLPGGSSTGSAVAVATGVVPMALGFDGGGSIRIPACLNGVYGLKPTLGRVPVSGHGAPSGSTVVHAGPIAAGCHELAAFLDATAGADGHDPIATGQPEPTQGAFVAALGRGVRGLRIGVPESEWADAPQAITDPAREALRSLTADGAEIVPVELPLAPHASAIGYLTIGLENAAFLQNHFGARIHVLEPYLQIFVGQFSAFGSFDYIDAQRLRAGLRRQAAEVLREVDLIALPTTGATAPPVTDAEAAGGFVDPPALHAISRFSYLGNLTGLPGGTAPVGMVDGLPVGLQLIADAWDEATILQTLAHLQRTGAAEAVRPESHVALPYA